MVIVVAVVAAAALAVVAVVGTAIFEAAERATVVAVAAAAVFEAASTATTKNKQQGLPTTAAEGPTAYIRGIQKVGKQLVGSRTLDYIRTEAGWSLGSFLPAILWYAY